MWIVKIALHRPYTFIVLALLTGAHLPIVNRNACEGKCDCVEVCPYDVFQVRRIEDEDFPPGKTVAACPERAISLIPNTNSREIPK